MKKLSLLLSAVMLLLAACSTGEDATHDHAVHQLPNGDLQERTASIEELPAFLDDKPEQMRLVYQAAAKHADLLEWIPCYCGCGSSAGHRSNKNCFAKKIEADGSIIWDDHGTRCGVCLNIAVQAIQMELDGMSVKQIRDNIDKLYAEGYGESTPTPMPN